jgi:hypothetical protein
MLYIGETDHQIPCSNPELAGDSVLYYLGKALGHCMIISPGCIIPGLALCTARALMGLPISGSDISIKDVPNPVIWDVLELVSIFADLLS